MSDELNGSTPPATSLWARQASTQVERATRRVRQVVEGLPAWEPLPPGEILVQRPRDY